MLQQADVIFPIARGQECVAGIGPAELIKICQSEVETRGIELDVVLINGNLE